MNQPQQPPDRPPTEGASPDHNATGQTPRGIPKGMEDHEATGHPTSDRGATETATHEIEKA